MQLATAMGEAPAPLPPGPTESTGTLTPELLEEEACIHPNAQVCTQHVSKLAHFSRNNQVENELLTRG